MAWNERPASSGREAVEHEVLLGTDPEALSIAATVDVEAVAGKFENRPGVALVRHYPYLCSRPGQEP